MIGPIRASIRGIYFELRELLMRIMRVLHAKRAVLSLSLLGLFAFLEIGCGDAAAPPPASPADNTAKEEAERAAREKAFGTKSGLPETKKK